MVTTATSREAVRSVAAVLHCPEAYLATNTDTAGAGQQTDRAAEEVVLLCHADWLQSLTSERTIPAQFTLHPTLSEREVIALVADRKLGSVSGGWSLLLLQIIPKGRVPQLIQGGERSDYEETLCISEVLQHVNRTNLKSSWISSHEKSATREISFQKPSSWIEDIVGYVTNIYGSDVPLIQEDLSVPCSKPVAKEGVEGLVPVDCLVLTRNIAILVKKYRPISVSKVLKFSPSVLADTSGKYLFVYYQILCIYKNFHTKRFFLGSHVFLEHFTITENLHIQFDPPIILEPKMEPTSISIDDIFRDNMKANEKSNEYAFLGEATAQWCGGKMSNLDYLLALNHAAGRRWGQPNNHPLVPWVCDFSSREGGGRDLARSKFRLNKGDAALDHNYVSGARCHVTDVLSEITYYTYKARVTDRAVLVRVVRPSWVPAEYPSSVRRMMEWSPDEAIPEFYTDPTIFSSIHPDLPDLELPEWTKDPQEFISWHRDLLESAEVTSQLHSWIDLTFGYKLSGVAAVRNKNVCLSLSDNHTDLRSHGVLQLFNHPHPTRSAPLKGKIPMGLAESEMNNEDSEYVEDSGSDHEDEIVKAMEMEKDSKIILPEACDPLAELLELEALNSFQTKVGVPSEKQNIFKENISRCSVRFMEHEFKNLDLQTLGCILVELFSHKKYHGQAKPFSGSYFEARRATALVHCKSLPASVRNTAEMLLNIETNVEKPSSLPPSPVTIHHLLHPLTSPLSLPGSFPAVVTVVRLAAELGQHRSPAWPEFCITTIARLLAPLLPGMVDTETLELVTPVMRSLLRAPGHNTAVLAAWLLFDMLAAALGRDRAVECIDIMSLYVNGTTTAKHAKLYHRTFLLSLIVRFRLKFFLDKFINPLIEAVGGYKDLEWDSDRQGLEETIICDKKEDTAGAAAGDRMASQESSNLQTPGGDSFAEGEVFAFDGVEDGDALSLSKHSGDVDVDTLEIVTQNLTRGRHISDESLNGILDIEAMTTVFANGEERRDDGTIASVAGESVMWLAQRLGPVLACRHLSRNLLRMLALCYAGPEAVQEAPDLPHRDQKVRVSSCRVAGDVAATPVLECLCQVVGLYGDSVVVVQYLPYCWDTLARAKRRISPSLEAGLLAAATLAHAAVPLLSDSALMHELPHSLLAHVLAPMLQVVTSRRVVFLSGARARLVLLFKLLDALYIIGLRIGEDMARIHLSPLAIGFFSALDKLENNDAVEDDEADAGAAAGLQQIKQVLNPAATFSAYVCFRQLLGAAHLEANICNLGLVKRLLKLHQAAVQRPVHRPASFLELQGLSPLGGGRGSSASYCGSGTGNMIVVSQSSEDAEGRGNDFNLINKPAVDSGRHLKGNWLAYWEHELGKDDRDNEFNFKQIKLQSFTGHVGGVKSLHPLDNENSFLSGGRDKTVRLWSVRNLGEGDSQVAAQSVFSGHKKSVFYVSFLPGPGHAVTCDGSLLVWDPFVMSTVAEFECGAKTTFCAARVVPEPGHCVLAATTEGAVRLLDTRAPRGGTCELRVSQGAAGLIRSLAVSRDGGQVAVGHSSGYISMLDTRTGRLKTGFKAHDGEVLTLTTINMQHFVSTSLDQLASGWRWDDGRQAAALRVFPEPLHCVASYEDSGVIMGSTANRLIVQRSVETDSPSAAHKLRSDLVRGSLSQLCVLPLNKQLLLASDTGTISLVC